MSDEPAAKKRKGDETAINMKSGGAYIPPAKLRMMQEQITDKSSKEYQRLSWEALKKSINGLINKVNVSNIKDISKELFQENLVRARGILARSIILAQNASPTFTHVYASLTSIINSRFPQNGELILRRVVAQFRRSYRRNLKDTCLHSVQFIAHLTNQQVAHEILGLQILTLLLETPTDDSVEVAIGFIKEAGQKLSEVSPRGIAAVFERLRHILHEQQLEKRVQYMVEVLFAIRKDGFKEHPAVIENLDLVDESEQFTHMLTLDDESITTGLETQLNVFRYDPNFEKTEENYKQIKKDILDESSEGSGSSSGDESSEESDNDDENEEDAEAKLEIQDKTETNLVALRRTIYLAVQSSLSFEECAHKILKMEFGEQDYSEICAMIVDCCSQLRTYEKFFGLLGGRFCMLKKEFMEQFEILFAQQYETIHRLETNKLRNVAKFFAHLLHSDSIPWSVLTNIKLSEETTSSSSRIFIKILFQEITEYIGIAKLNERLKDPTMAPFFEGLFPRDDPRNTRFAINFFTSIGLGGITDDLREHLTNAARLMAQKLKEEQLAALINESSSSSSDSDSESLDEESSSTEERKKRKKQKNKKTKKVKKQPKKRPKKKTKSSSESSDSESSDDDSPNVTVRSTIAVVQKIPNSTAEKKTSQVNVKASKKKRDSSSENSERDVDKRLKSRQEEESSKSESDNSESNNSSNSSDGILKRLEIKSKVLNVKRPSRDSEHAKSKNMRHDSSSSPHQDFHKNYKKSSNDNRTYKHLERERKEISIESPSRNSRYAKSKSKRHDSSSPHQDFHKAKNKRSARSTSSSSSSSSSSSTSSNSEEDPSDLNQKRTSSKRKESSSEMQSNKSRYINTKNKRDFSTSPHRGSRPSSDKRNPRRSSNVEETGDHSKKHLDTKHSELSTERQSSNSRYAESKSNRDLSSTSRSRYNREKKSSNNSGQETGDRSNQRHYSKRRESSIERQSFSSRYAERKKTRDLSSSPRRDTRQERNNRRSSSDENTNDRSENLTHKTRNTEKLFSNSRYINNNKDHDSPVNRSSNRKNARSDTDTSSREETEEPSKKRFSTKRKDSNSKPKKNSRDFNSKTHSSPHYVNQSSSSSSNDSSDSSSNDSSDSSSTDERDDISKKRREAQREESSTKRHSESKRKRNSSPSPQRNSRRTKKYSDETNDRDRYRNKSESPSRRKTHRFSSSRVHSKNGEIADDSPPYKESRRKRVTAR